MMPYDDQKKKTETKLNVIIKGKQVLKEVDENWAQRDAVFMDFIF